MQRLTKEEIKYTRFFNSGLFEPFLDCQEAASRLFGVQAQYQQFADLNLYNRVTGLKKDQLTDLYQANDLIKLWGQRMTVHLYMPKDWGLLQALYQTRHNWVKKKFAERGFDLEAMLSELEELLLTRGEVDKKEIAMLLGENSKELLTWGGILIQASLDGTLYCVPESPKTRHYRHRNQLAAPPGHYTKDAAIMELMKRYFSAYGPASLRDFKHWSGLKRGDFIALVDEALADFKQVEDEQGTVLYSSSADFLLDGQPGVMLLGKFDPLFVSYADKSWITTENERGLIWRKAGQIESVLLIDGHFRGTWRYRIQGPKIWFQLFPTRKISKYDWKRIETKCQQVAGFMEKEFQEVVIG
ncbi:DNA glycosylase AlkZ-like family protein [Listeria ilorinensis]|uniref:DNA glycosylase AlkZ-like family protein n=1 Tax=Listeria ilorinensis TaxID=2867439 RepID=UPI001EF74EC4|nr:crosslink repair DNA glycosylase YcaQ family protein [Listeria ilorinensis]